MVQVWHALYFKKFSTRCRSAIYCRLYATLCADSLNYFFAELQIFVALFLICFLPTHVLLMWFHFDADSQNNYNHFWNSLKIVGFVFAYANSCVNPVALYFISANFRKHFHQLLFSCCRSAENSSVDDETTRPRPQDRRRQYGRRNLLNEFKQRDSHQLASFEVTFSNKRTTSSQNDSDVPQIVVVCSVRDDKIPRTIHRNPLSVTSPAHVMTSKTPTDDDTDHTKET